jgi:DNA-binding MarR family transcriptional regulator
VPGNDDDAAVAAVERAMVAVRRSQSRRVLARLASRRGERPGPARGAAEPTVAGPAFDVLDVVEAAERAGAAVTVSDVAVALDVDQPRASRVVAAAVEAGMVRREADQADGRRTLLVTTDAGRTVSERVHGFRRSVFAEAMAGWPAADRAEFARLLTSFVDALARLAEPAPAQETEAER